MLTKKTHAQISERQTTGRPDIPARIAHPSRCTSHPPVHWWRTRRPQDFEATDVRILRAELFKTDAIDDCDWLYAVTGNAAAAIGIAIRALKQHGMTNPAIDAVVSAVLCCALEGDGASKVLLLSALRRRQKIDPRCRHLVLLWSDKDI
ncbi:hypothetical protein [Bradyrhizobium sp. SZCCHNR1039]|uniref:hypothetical protein n=1 Tax=Bradyrhizobium sp. SZCCHNR1039 TaxID=3057350 RepID=UPI0029163695|nr:hypothetical protein [Bradyrhizobium sp. SZCCHNR1039]